MKKAISILSGGLDCCVATTVFNKEYEIHAITFNYGQKAFKQAGLMYTVSLTPMVK